MSFARLLFVGSVWNSGHRSASVPQNNTHRRTIGAAFREPTYVDFSRTGNTAFPTMQPVCPRKYDANWRIGGCCTSSGCSHVVERTGVAVRGSAIQSLQLLDMSPTKESDVLTCRAVSQDCKVGCVLNAPEGHIRP